MLLPAWEEYQMAQVFHCSPLEIRLLPEDRYALYLAFMRGESDAREILAARQKQQSGS